MELNCIVDGIRLVGTAIKKLNIENNIADIGYNGKNNFGFNINHKVIFDYLFKSSYMPV